ncbi:hypothetical protein BUALT_Bualt15G0048100 [Buddleja alternifolia]|uniref:Uncharacterized protein n=1 Tax=Buddleja alternifolia TaxID=168488 RepID=A0AAV6WKU5_9LAMI|nr:hypothetical protein BUALT_Bualt15G0048100 [Buddleja alternifolia]
MDLGCIDMGCVEKPRKETSIEKENSPKESVMSASKKSNRAKDAVRSSLSALNKLTSQITKPPHRKTSPLNWFPRKKVEPYLKRKIKMLQEVDGMHSTLDETLGDTNPHYCRVLREKMAIREAAEKAMEARKAAMIEASWCRILQAARIECKEAEAQLSKAEHSAAEAFEAARAVGVIMKNIPESAQIHFKIETISAKGSSTTDTVSATFETAFEVDKQVAAAVKTAFIKLAHCPSINKEEFKELLRKISENPDLDENHNDLSGFTSECESDAGSELEVGSYKDSLKKRRDSDNFNMSNIVEMMLDRLRCLKEDELASLATIVATCGLNASLAEAGNIKNTENPSVNRLTRLEREVLEAKNARKNDEEKLLLKKSEEGPTVSDFGSTLVKHTSKLEKEVEEAKMNNHKSSEINSKNFQRVRAKQEVDEVPSLEKFLVKNLDKSRLEKEKMAALEKQENDDDSFRHSVSRRQAREQELEATWGGLSLGNSIQPRVSRLERDKARIRFWLLGLKPKKRKRRGRWRKFEQTRSFIARHKFYLEDKMQNCGNFSEEEMQRKRAWAPCLVSSSEYLLCRLRRPRPMITVIAKNKKCFTCNENKTFRPNKCSTELGSNSCKSFLLDFCDRLNDNKLSGSIPRELTTLSNLKVFDVSNNDLCGTIPVDGPFGSFPMESYENTRLNGPELKGDWGACAPQMTPYTDKCEYDVMRSVRMAGYGLLILGPTIHYWYTYMSRVFPKRDIASTLKKMALGQTFYGPAMTVIFFSANAALQGESGSEIMARLKRDLIPTFINGIMYWPICDFVTFKFIPVHLQPLVTNSFSYLWTVYMTYMASLEKVGSS